MKVTTERLEGSQVRFNIEVEPERTEKSMQRAYKKLVNKVNIPGFRRGKAPRAIVERFVGKEALFQEGVDILLPEIVKEAVEEAGITPISEPEVDVAQEEPLVINVTVAVRPEIDPGNYRQIRMSRQPVNITDTQLDEVIEHMREDHAEWTPVERPVAAGELATIDVEGFGGHRPLLYAPEGQPLLHAEKGKVFLDQKNVEYLVNPEAGNPVPGFADQVVGMNAGDEKEFQLLVPADNPRFEKSELAGQQVTFRVKVQAVKEKHLPEMDDDFAKTSGIAQDMSGLREELHKRLKSRAEADEEHRLMDLIVDRLVDQASFDVPEVLVSQEVDNMLDSRERMLKYQGTSLDLVLREEKKTKDELRKEMAPQAARRLKGMFLVHKIGELENIEATADEVDAEVERIKSILGDKATISDKRRDGITADLRHHKSLHRLVDLVTREGDEEEAPIEAAETSEATQTADTAEEAAPVGTGEDKPE